MGMPRYQKVYETLQKRIADGQYAVGDLLPTEQDLCSEFEVSRYTIREALRRLTEIGIVSRRQGSGSEVIRSERTNNYVQTMRSLRELYDYASETTLDIHELGMIVADEDLSAKLSRVPGRAWLRVNAVRKREDGETICFAQVFLHSDYKEIGEVLQTIKGPFYRYLEEHFDVEIEEVVQTIHAEPFSPEAAQALGLKAGSTAIVVERRYLGPGDEPIQMSINWHPPETFSYSMTIRREDLPG